MSKIIQKPNLLIVGAQKSGTTSLHNYLSHHPDVYMSEIKELAYFSREHRPFSVPNKEDRVGYLWYSKRLRISCDEEYLEHFSKHKNEKIIGESSAEYLYYFNTAQSIYRFNPHMKIIIILRNPVNRAFSAYSDLKFRLPDIGSFSEELELEKERISQSYHYKWHFKNVGMYYQQVKAYLEYFPGDQIKIILFEDLITDTSTVMREVCEFLGINHSFYENYNFEKYNLSGVPKNRMISDWINRGHSIKSLFKKLIPNSMRQRIKRTVNSINLTKENMDAEIQNTLRQFYKKDIEQLEDMIKIDLSRWKGV